MAKELLGEAAENHGDGFSVWVAAFYRFVRLEGLQTLQSALRGELERFQLRGSILIAEEGINGMLAGTQENIHAFFRQLRSDARFESLSLKFSQCEKVPFRRAKVRIKKEIVACKDLSIDAAKQSRGHLDPNAWDELLARPGVTLIDVRNDYEYDFGHFNDAINPNTKTFSEFSMFVKEQLSPEGNPTIAMYCTGGIRCEKASVIMRELGYPEVYQLDGGILNYFEHHKNSKRQTNTAFWQGDCFVFDERVAVNEHLAPVDHAYRCLKCGQPCRNAEICDRCAGSAKSELV